MKPLMTKSTLLQYSPTYTHPICYPHHSILRNCRHKAYCIQKILQGQWSRHFGSNYRSLYPSLARHISSKDNIDNLQHSSAYSTPANEYPAFLQAWIHNPTVIALEPPVTAANWVSARPFVPSLFSSRQSPSSRICSHPGSVQELTCNSHRSQSPKFQDLWMVLVEGSFRSRRL